MQRAERWWGRALLDLGLLWVLTMFGMAGASALAAPPPSEGGAQVHTLCAREITGVLDRRIGSPSLREGLAEHLGLLMQPSQAVGHADAARRIDPQLLQALLPLIGSSAPPPDAWRKDLRLRVAYCAASQHWVRHLLDRAGPSQFMLLYASQAPESAYPWLYGQSREALLAEVFPTSPR